LLRRAFGVLGPVEAAVALAAFSTALLLAGWSPGDEPPAAVLAGASGAAFTAVVLGQMANAFACRSTSRPAWRLGWRSNPLLLWAVVVELLALLAFLFIPPVADALEHAPPPLVPAAVALVAVPAVLVADAIHKWRLAVAR
jgi:magnesium-transporting ATPase (P-type)